MEDVGRLLISCPDRPGIVAAVSRFLYERQANIVHSDQHSTDPFAGTFFMRAEFFLSDLPSRAPRLREEFEPLARELQMEWRLALAQPHKRLAVFVTREDHGLLELLWRVRAGDLPAQISLVISNRPDLRDSVETWGLPFHHVPANEPDTEERQLDLLQGRVEAVVLARYMQLVGPRLLAAFPNAVINIHHGFLPAFAGANPYAQAHRRGVKLIGATAHYATEQLDAGPIIEQDVQRVDHRHTKRDLQRLGRYLERVVLARAVGWHVEDRVIVHEGRTVVFG